MRKLKIEIKKLSKNFEKRFVLKDLDLNIYESESLSIIGESGSGKVSFSKMYNRIDRI